MATGPARYAIGRGAAAIAGVASIVAGTGAGHLLAGVIGPDASPVLAVGAAVVDAAPAGLKEFAIRTLGTADKPVLIVAVVLIAALLGAAAGLLQRRGLGVWLLLVVAGVCSWAAVSRPAAGTYDILPGLIAGLVAMLVLTTLMRNARVESADSLVPATDSGDVAPDRRTTLGAAVATAAGLAAGGGGWALSRPEGVAGTPIVLPRPVKRLAPLPTGLESTTPGLSPFRTPVRDFYRVDTALRLPQIDPASWTLQIDGDVEAPYSLSFDELLAMPMDEADITLNCVSNPVGGEYIGSTRWLGVPIKDVLQRAKVRASADQILSTSVDGMTISTPVGALLDNRGALLAVAMDGRPLTREHGAPVRLITPGLYGYVGATKWLSRLTATTYAARAAYWTERGWAERADVHTQARIDAPEPGDLAAGSVLIAGVAWSQARQGISAVEVRVDDGPWTPAELGPAAGGHYWRQWRHEWTATAGEHTISVRAYDGTNTPQTEKVADPVPSGATGLHSIKVEVG